MTGTPIQKNYPDLFTQLYFLSPLILGYTSWFAFAANHIEYSKKYKGQYTAHNTRYLTAKMEPYVYTVTKEECLDLPGKMYTTRYFDMTSKQRKLYNETKESIASELYDSDGNENACIIYKMFTACQEIASGFLNSGSSKIEIDNPRIELLNDIIEETGENKIVIWCKYQNDIESIVTSLSRDRCSLFYGGLNTKQRELELERFKNGESRFFVATQSCGGFGLTLVESAYVIYYNNEFNYATRKQSEDRTYRIGQTRKVQYIDIVCEKSIDYLILQCLEKKVSITNDFKQKLRAVNTKNGLRKLIKEL
jgi:SNF2 family DNA or RNA helicase